jgi:hypothetical protein
MEQRHFGEGDNISGNKTVNNVFSIGRKGIILLGSVFIICLSGIVFYYLKYVKEPDLNVLSFQLDTAYDDPCQFPYIFPNSVINGQQVDTTVTFERGKNDKSIGYARFPAHFPDQTNNYETFFGFGLPFHIISNSKQKTTTIGNKFKVKVKVEPPMPFANVNMQCAGDGTFSKSKEKVVLTADRKSYEKVISFPNAPFFTGKPNELNSFEVFFEARDAGTYHIEVEVPYTFGEKTGVAIFKAPDLIVPLKYHNWQMSVLEDKNDKLQGFERDNGIGTWENGAYRFDYAANSPKSFKNANPNIAGDYPFTSTEMLTGDDLFDYEPSEFKFMRNEIFARHGCIFETTEMKNYFSAKKWYKPQFDKNTVMNQLSDIEKHNVEVIKKAEGK